MDKTKSAIGYILNSYPKSEKFSISRLTKMLYLCDWKSALQFDNQISEITWEISYSGPFSRDIEDILFNDDVFIIFKGNLPDCGEVHFVKLRRPVATEVLNPNDKRVIDFVAKVTSELKWDKFLEVVYSTFPILNEERYKKINLIELAKLYKSKRRNLVLA
ncbi:MAG: SocA family protein [Chloroflexi bacterium]|nr:SocA family protein [Chloroflexota bacterium]